MKFYKVTSKKTGQQWNGEANDKDHARAKALPYFTGHEVKDLKPKLIFNSNRK